MNKHFKFPLWNPELEQVVDDFIKSIQTENTKDFGWSWTRPLANITEEGDNYLIHLAAPGLTKSDFKLSIDQHLLKVEVDKVKPDTDVKKLKTEYSFYKFTRQFKINENVNTDAIQAAYEQGILIITLPKKAEASQPSKTINVL
ncbi:MAG: Hsp20/alpha crystallin family protein [Saprospiraceae bacterium]